MMMIKRAISTLIPRLAAGRKKGHFSLYAALLLGLIALAPAAYAADGNTENNMPKGTCTFDPQFALPQEVITPGNGIISNIVTDVKSVLTATIIPMYQNIISSPSFTGPVTVALTLYIAIYGILFTFGMVQVTVYDFFIRMLKFGVIAGFIISAEGWASEVFWILNDFFVEGTDAIIAEATTIMVGGVRQPYNEAQPFAALDALLATAISSRMAVTILATIFTGPYGLVFAILILLSLGAMMRAFLSAIWIYLMGLVLKMLLIALAPIFITFLLFDRTRHLFDGWLNQMVNACLQPIFVFIFFAFFVSLLKASIDNILKTPVCWTEWMESVRGTPQAFHYWRFAVKNKNGDWEAYSGTYNFDGIADDPKAPIFPIDIMAVLIFLVLAELASRFNNVVVMIASEIASASARLSDFQGPMSDWLNRGGGSGGASASAAAAGVGSRPIPGGSSAASMSSSKASIASKGMMGAAEDGIRERISMLSSKRQST
ncbi:MAG: type IV secretion system protein [Alphaproteobacteria bacterium]|nr:type IV secretion system protein [Alphaproteobacteria bacterium]